MEDSDDEYAEDDLKKLVVECFSGKHGKVKTIPNQSK